jgi:hypothetical protein
LQQGNLLPKLNERIQQGNFGAKNFGAKKNWRGNFLARTRFGKQYCKIGYTNL